MAIRAAAADIAIRYGGDSKYAQRVKIANEWFKESKKELDDALDTGILDKTEYNKKVRALSNV